MKLLERIINPIAKRIGYVPVQQVNRALRSFKAASTSRLVQQVNRALRSFKAASTSRLFADWTTSTTSADADTRTDLVVMRARARDVRKNYEYGRKFGTLAKTNVLGEVGITLRNKAKDPDRVQGGKLIAGPLDIFANKQIEDAWWYWGKKENCTVTRKLCWLDVQRIILDSVLTDGEHLIRKVKGFKNDFSFALQLLESDHLDVELNKDLGNGNKIKMGVEMNQWQEPIAYHVYRDNPNDWYYYGLGTSVSQRYYRLPATEIVHPFLAERAGQTRGVPWLATALPSLMRLSAYEEAELVASDVAAAKMGFFKKVGDAQYQGDKEANTGHKLMSVEPGHFEELPEGLELEKWDPQHPNGNYAGFVKACIRRVAAGLGVSYNMLGEDMESVNFASGKLSLDAERRVWRCLQGWFSENVCTDIFSDWLDAAMMSWPGLKTLPPTKFEKFNSPTWQGPSWPHVNPLQEMSAIESKLRLRLTSWTREIIALGLDPGELWDEIESDEKEMERRGIEPTGAFSTLKEMAETEMVENGETQPPRRKVAA